MTAQTPTPVTEIDWLNRAYTTDCAGISPQPFTAEVTGGRATTSSGTVEGGDEYYEIVLGKTTTGDLTGDTQPEAAVYLYCKPEPTSPNLYGTEAQIYTADAERLGPALKSQDAAPGSSIYDSQLLDQPFTITDKQLMTGAEFRTDGQCRACPPTERVLTWRWNGERLLPE